MSNTIYPQDHFSIPCGLKYGEKECYSCKHAKFASYIIIIILCPAAVVGNALILAAIGRKTFQRTSFHVLLSGLALTDLCTGPITQPFYAGNALLYFTDLRADSHRSVLIKILSTISNVSIVYFGAVTLLIITLVSIIERWLHISRRSSVTSHRGCLTATVLLLIPIPVGVFTTFNTINGTYDIEVDTASVAFILVCYVTTFSFYFKVLRIIRQHHQQVEGNQPSQNFGQPAINLAKYNSRIGGHNYIYIYSCCILYLFVAYYCFAGSKCTLRLPFSNRGCNKFLLGAFIFIIFS